MAKKKKNVQKTSFAESIGFVNIFRNERFNFFIGALLLLVAGYFVLSFISFFLTGEADQSIIENMQDEELRNEKGQIGNYCGSIGAITAYFFIKQCFGLAAFFIPAFLLLMALQLMKAYKLNLWKWFFSMMVLMIWSSVTMAVFLTPLFENIHFYPGGDHGLAIRQIVEGYIGMPGLLAVLVLVALAFLIYVSTETVVLIRKILNPSKFIDRIKFKVIDTSKEEVEPEDSYEKQIETQEDPLVFDNPETETVEFNHEPRPLKTEKNDEETVREKVSQAEKKPRSEKEKDLDLDIELAGEEETADKSKPVAKEEEHLEPYDPKRDLENYHYPTLDLLKTYESDGKPYIDMTEQTANKNRIVEVLRNFGIEIAVSKQRLARQLLSTRLLRHKV